MKIQMHIPNLFTCINLFCGCLAIVYAFLGYMHYAAILIGIASVFDFLDGFAARLLNSYSSIGKELDSLADMVSFGLTPAIIMFQFLQANLTGGYHIAGINILAISAFLLAIFSAIRLAKFNVDQRQTENFIGLPTPANALFFASMPFVLYYGTPGSFVYIVVDYLVMNPIASLLLVFTFSYLLVSGLNLFSLKFHGFGVKENKVKYLFLAGTIILLAVFQLSAFPLIIVFYISLSLLTNKNHKLS